MYVLVVNCCTYNQFPCSKCVAQCLMFMVYIIQYIMYNSHPKTWSTSRILYRLEHDSLKYFRWWFRFFKIDMSLISFSSIDLVVALKSIPITLQTKTHYLSKNSVYKIYNYSNIKSNLKQNSLKESSLM